VAYIREVKPSPRFPRPRWRVYHETTDGEVKVGTYDSAVQAERVCDQVRRYGLEAVMGAGRPPGPSEPADKSATLFGEYVTGKWWPAWKANHPDSEPRTKYQLNGRLLPRFGDVALADIDADMIGLGKGDMVREDLAPRTSTPTCRCWARSSTPPSTPATSSGHPCCAAAAPAGSPSPATCLSRSARSGSPASSSTGSPKPSSPATGR
jgi:hypothetical protein